MTHHTHRFAMLFAAALAAALLAAPAAHAFTFERNASGDSGASLNYTDPITNLAPKQDDATRSDGNANVYQNGSFSMQMRQFNGSSGSFDQRYNGSNLLDPFAREGR
jgi:hypothetical protein